MAISSAVAQSAHAYETLTATKDAAQFSAGTPGTAEVPKEIARQFRALLADPAQQVNPTDSMASFARQSVGAYDALSQIAVTHAAGTDLITPVELLRSQFQIRMVSFESRFLHSIQKGLTSSLETQLKSSS